MSQATAFAAEQLRQLMEDARPALEHTKTYAAVNRRSLPDIHAVNDLVRVWWDTVVVTPAWADLPQQQRQAMEAKFLENIAKHEGITPKVLDYAIMCAFFKGFAEAGKALPQNRAEPIRGYPEAAGQAGDIMSYERLSGVDVAPFLRGRVFAALTKAGLIAKADMLTLMTLVDEMEAEATTNPLYEKPHAVNIEPASLLHADDYTQLETQLRRLPAHLMPRLCVEVTERGRDNPRLKTIFANLALLKQATGCLLAYDDYRGLEGEDEHLLILQPDSVKIDGALIRPLLVEPKPDSPEFKAGIEEVRGLMARIVEHAPAAKIVAEWAETPEAYQALAALGVDAVQSYVLENRAKANPALLHLPAEVLAMRETALANLASKRGSGKELLGQKQEALRAMEHALNARLAHEMAA